MRPGQHQEAFEKLVCLIEPLLELGPQHRHLGWGLWLAQGYVDGRAHHGQGCAQFVGCVGHKSALRLKGCFQTGEQAVDGVAEVLQLVVRPSDIEAFVQVHLGDFAGAGGHCAQRAQHAPGHEPTKGDRYEAHYPEGDQGYHEQVVTLGGRGQCGNYLPDAGRRGQDGGSRAAKQGSSRPPEERLCF